MPVKLMLRPATPRQQPLTRSRGPRCRAAGARSGAGSMAPDAAGSRRKTPRLRPGAIARSHREPASGARRCAERSRPQPVFRRSHHSTRPATVEAGGTAARAGQGLRPPSVSAIRPSNVIPPRAGPATDFTGPAKRRLFGCTFNPPSRAPHRNGRTTAQPEPRADLVEVAPQAAAVPAAIAHVYFGIGTAAIAVAPPVRRRQRPEIQHRATQPAEVGEGTCGAAIIQVLHDVVADHQIKLRGAAPGVHRPVLPAEAFTQILTHVQST